NFDRRIEILVPVEQARARQEINAIFDSALADNMSSWELKADGAWERITPKKGERTRSHQAALHRRADGRVRRAGRSRERYGPGSDRPDFDNGGDEGRSRRRGLQHRAAARRRRGGQRAGAGARG